MRTWAGRRCACVCWGNQINAGLPDDGESCQTLKRKIKPGAQLHKHPHTHTHSQTHTHTPTGEIIPKRHTHTHTHTHTHISYEFFRNIREQVRLKCGFT